MRRKDLWKRILAEALALSMAAGVCLPGTAVWAAQEKEEMAVQQSVEEEGAPADGDFEQALFGGSVSMDEQPDSDELSFMKENQAQTGGDLQALENAVAQAKALDEDLYRPQSWAAFREALTKSQEVLDAASQENIAFSQEETDEAQTRRNAVVTQAESDEALAQLSGAMARLEKAYVLMNIPYDDFYKAEVKNDVQVDAFTSATLNKSRTNSSAMAQGSYHVDPNGTDVTGVTYPVKLGDDVSLEAYKKVLPTDSVSITVSNRGQTSTTSYNGADALFENPSYAYYELEEAPAYYKEATMGADGKLTFGKATGARTVRDGVTAELMTQTGYGDYQMNLDGLDLGGAKVYGIVLETKEGHGYGLRHVENIWRQTQLAWCTGFTEKVHNCPTSSAHYAQIMGETIQKAVYYTSGGILEIPLSEYVPVKFSHTLEVKNTAATAGSASVKLTGLPADFQPQYSVAGLNVQASDSQLKFTAEDGGKAVKGKYTLAVEDRTGRYAPLYTDFELYTENMPAIYVPAQKALIAAQGSEEDFADYLKNIASVAVDGESYAASGRGSVSIVGENGVLKTDAQPLADKEKCDICIYATGYQPLEFTYPQADTSELQAAIAAAEKVKKDDYTAKSYAKAEAALKTAKEALARPGTQTAADNAARQLNEAVKALVKKQASKPARPKKGTVSTYDKVKYQIMGSNTAEALQAANKSLTSAKIPAAITVNGYSFKVTAIADKAFSGCGKLKTVEIAANVTSVGNDAFAGCKALSSIKGMAKAKTIGSRAFYGCMALKKVNLTSAALTKIGASAFQGCTALTSFTANSTQLSAIGKNAFYGDGKLASVSLKTGKLTKAKVGAQAFKKIKSACTFKVPAKKTAAYKAIFQAKGAGKKIKVKKL